MPPCYFLVLHALCAEAREGKEHEGEKFGVEGGAEKSAGAVEIGADFMDGRVEPAAVNGFHTGKPVEIGDHKDDTDRPEEIHNLRQRSEVILLLAHNKMCLGLELGAVSAFLFTLHTPAEFFLVGIERLSRLEQVKARQCEVVISGVALRSLVLGRSCCLSLCSSGR